MPLVSRSKSMSFRTPLSPLPQPPRLFASRPHSQVLSFGDFETKRRKWSRIDQLIFSVYRLLKQEKNEKAVKIFKSGVSGIPFRDHAFRSSAYERGITAFLNHKLYKDAVELHQQMFAEGMYSSSGLRARILVCSDIVTAPHEQREELESLYEKLSHVVSLSSFSEPRLRELLDVMRGHPLIDLQFVRKLVGVYVKAKSRGSKYELESSTINKLIQFYVHAGSMDTAESLVIPHGEPADNHPRHTNARPYTTLISELTKKGAMSSKRLSLLLDRMEQSQISVDLPLINTLVQSAVRRGNFHQAFSLYETILRDPASHMIPDSFTFGSLFNALQRLLACSLSVRLARQPPNAPTSRQLFRQMLDCHVLAAQAADPCTNPVMRVSTLNVALRLFMLSVDYPGAFVTLQTFRVLGLRPDARSYRFVFTILLAHVKAGLLLGQSQWRCTKWAVNFLGQADVQPEDIWPEVADALLEFARGVGDTRFHAPELVVMLRDRKGRENAEWDIEPLERLVGRAILATIAPMGMSEEQAERTLREKMVPYFYEMVPNRLWRGRRLPWATY